MFKLPNKRAEKAEAQLKEFKAQHAMLLNRLNDYNRATRDLALAWSTTPVKDRSVFDRRYKRLHEALSHSIHVYERYRVGK